MNIDFPLIGLISTIIACLNVTMLALFRRINPCFDGVAWWIAALSIWAFCFMLFMLRLAVPIDWLTTLLPNLLAMVASVIGLVGICRFCEKPYPVRLVSTLAGACFTTFVILHYIHPEFPYRIIIVGIFSVGMWSVSIWRLSAGVPKGHELSRYTAASICIVFALNDLIRLVRAAYLLWEGDVYTMDYWVGASMVVNSIFLIPLNTFSHALLMGQRQVINSRETERELQETRVRLAERQIVRQKETLLRDLHDGLSGTITAIGLNSRHLIGRANSENDESLKALRQLAAMSNFEIRSIMQRVGAATLPWRNIQKELHEFATVLLKSSNIGLIWEDGEPPDAPITDEAAVDSFTRMIKEAIHNVVKHSGSTEARIQWTFRSDVLGIVIQDNGCGLGPGLSSGRGLRHMKRRAEELEGDVHFTDESGLTVTFKIPLPLTLAHDSHLHP